jgi:[acyl-carrier-protein] S-malonyltransferase
MGKTAFLFPGQGAQVVGMGKDLADRYPQAAETFGEANDVLGLDLRRVCFEGPADVLRRTDVSQPAILTMSVAALRAARAAGVVTDCDMAGGLSLGEYTALWAAGAVPFADVLRLVHLRGRAMQEASEATDSGMVALVGADGEAAEAVCREAAEGDVLVCANFNTPGQVVVSGSSAACERAVKVGEARGLRCVALEVAGAFHSPLMAPAAERLAGALADVTIQPPRVPVAANVAGGFHAADPGAIRTALVAQVTGCVRWQACVEAMLAAGTEQFFEIGPGRTLTGMLRKITRQVRCTPLGTVAALEKALG